MDRDPCLALPHHPRRCLHRHPPALESFQAGMVQRQRGGGRGMRRRRRRSLMQLCRGGCSSACAGFVVVRPSGFEEGGGEGPSRLLCPIRRRGRELGEPEDFLDDKLNWLTAFDDFTFVPASCCQAAAPPLVRSRGSQEGSESDDEDDEANLDHDGRGASCVLERLLHFTVHLRTGRHFSSTTLSPSLILLLPPPLAARTPLSCSHPSPSCPPRVHLIQMLGCVIHLVVDLVNHHGLQLHFLVPAADRHT
eukprot:768316-Hanusia_phi.AAC.5